MEKFRCPNCGEKDSLSRIEALYAYANVSQTKDGGWEYGDESSMDWDSQGRELVQDLPEFMCHSCGFSFDWDRDEGFSLRGDHLSPKVGV